MRVLIACSSGGHLAQAWALKPWWEQHERLWVTLPTADVAAKLAGERVVLGHSPTVRNVPNLLRNFALARRVLRDYQPDLVFSTGAAIAVPFMSLARSVGARTAYLETVDRMSRPSLSGSLVYPFADQFLTQWKGLERVLPQAQHVGMVL